MIPRKQRPGGFGRRGPHGEQGQMVWSEVRKVGINCESRAKAGRGVNEYRCGGWGTHAILWEGFAFAGGGIGSPFLLPLTLCMTTNFCHTLVMTVHAVYAMARLGKDELVDSVVADFALEAVCVIGVVSGHDCFVEDGLLADVAIVAALCTDGGSI